MDAGNGIGPLLMTTPVVPVELDEAAGLAVEVGCPSRDCTAASILESRVFAWTRPRLLERSGRQLTAITVEATGVGASPSVPIEDEAGVSAPGEAMALALSFTVILGCSLHGMLAHVARC